MNRAIVVEFWARDGQRQVSADDTGPREGGGLHDRLIKTLRVDKGFGFIKGSDGSQYFFHQSAIYGEGIDMLREGDSVEFELGQDGPKGPRAESVRRTST